MKFYLEGVLTPTILPSCGLVDNTVWADYLSRVSVSVVESCLSDVCCYLS